MAKEYKLPYTASEINQKLAKTDLIDNKADLINGKVPLEQLPDDIVSGGSDVDLSDYYTKTETDTVLSAKADLVEGKIPASQLPDNIGNGGGVTSWNDLEDKPFYENGWSIDWDGSVDNREMVTLAEVDMDGMLLGYYAIKVSDLALQNDAMGAIMKMNSPDGDIECQFTDILYGENCWGATNNDELGVTAVVNVTSLPASMDFEMFGAESVPFPSEGLYFLGMYVNRDYTQAMGRVLNISKLDVKTLEPKFIPDMYYDTREIYRFDTSDTPYPTSYSIPAFGMTGYKIFDCTPTKEEFVNLTITSSTGNYTFTTKQIMVDFGEDGFLIIADRGQAFGLCRKAGVYTGEYSGVSFTCDVPESGIYYITSGELPTARIFEIILGGELEYIDDKFIPNTIARKSDLDSVSVDLSNYYTKSEVYDKSQIDTALDNVSVDLSGYYTKSEVYNKSEIDNGYYTKTEIDDVFASIGILIDEINELIGE